MSNICNDHNVVNPDKVRVLLKERDILQNVENTLSCDVEYALKEIDAFSNNSFSVILEQ